MTTIHKAYIPPGRAYRERIAAERAVEADRAAQEMRALGYPPSFIREELARIRNREES